MEKGQAAKMADILTFWMVNFSPLCTANILFYYHKITIHLVIYLAQGHKGETGFENLVLAKDHLCQMYSSIFLMTRRPYVMSWGQPSTFPLKPIK